MTSVAIIMEGGGERASGRAAIRQGMDQFLAPVKQLARERAMRWKLTPWGSRSDAYRRFRTAVRDQEADVVILLVDSEGPVHAPPKRHLTDHDGWNLDFAGDNAVHLMIQSMETWIVADTATLAAYYGHGFRPTALPSTNDLESIDRNAIADGLKQATRNTRKGPYQKIRDGGQLLAHIDADVVSIKCPSCATLFKALNSLLGPK